jgi:hypothetical protein
MKEITKILSVIIALLIITTMLPTTVIQVSAAIWEEATEASHPILTDN